MRLVEASLAALCLQFSTRASVANMKRSNACSQITGDRAAPPDHEMRKRDPA